MLGPCSAAVVSTRPSTGGPGAGSPERAGYGAERERRKHRAYGRALELACAIVNQARPMAASSVRQARAPAAPAPSCQGFAGVATLALVGGAWTAQAKRGRTTVAWSSSAALLTPDIRLSYRNARDSRLEIGDENLAIQRNAAKIQTADGNGFVKRLRQFATQIGKAGAPAKSRSLITVAQPRQENDE